MTTAPTLLIDADMVLYETAYATENAIHWDDDLWVLGANLSESKELFDTKITQLAERFATDRLVLTLSDRHNFRKDVDETYKAQRKKVRKPLIFPALREYVEAQYDCVIRKGLEADDVMGILATSPKTENPLIVSDDKDLKTIPGTLYRLGVLSTQTLEDADRFWLTQALTGDPADGYSGCPGIGPAAATKVLDKSATFDAVVAAYEKHGLTYDDALRNTRLARILRYEDWDPELQKVILWTPPGVAPESASVRQGTHADVETCGGP